MVFVQETSGKAASKDVPTLVLLSGFPDLSHSWSRLRPHFEDTHHIISLHMPGYELPKLPAGHFWGYSFDDIIAGLAAVIEPHYKTGSKIHLVGHDWGSAIVQLYAFRFPKTVDKLILVDIGKYGSDGLSLKEMLLTFGYQSWLSICFVVSRVSSRLALIFLMLYPWSFIGPTPYDTDKPFKMEEFKIHMTYPYLHYSLSKFRNHKETKALNNFETSFPVQYLYGGKKRLNFHSKSYLTYLDSRSDCQQKCFENEGHYLHWTSSDAVAKEMKAFLE